MPVSSAFSSPSSPAGKLADVLAEKKQAEQARPAAGYLPESGFVRETSLVGPHGILPINRSTLWRWVKAKKFPAPYRIGPNTTAWRVDDVRQWLAEKEAT